MTTPTTPEQAYKLARKAWTWSDQHEQAAALESLAEQVEKLTKERCQITSNATKLAVIAFALIIENYPNEVTEETKNLSIKLDPILDSLISNEDKPIQIAMQILQSAIDATQSAS